MPWNSVVIPDRNKSEKIHQRSAGAVRSPEESILVRTAKRALRGFHYFGIWDYKFQCANWHNAQFLQPAREGPPLLKIMDQGWDSPGRRLNNWTWKEGSSLINPGRGLQETTKPKKKKGIIRGFYSGMEWKSDTLQMRFKQKKDKYEKLYTTKFSNPLPTSMNHSEWLVIDFSQTRGICMNSFL